MLGFGVAFGTNYIAGIGVPGIGKSSGGFTGNGFLKRPGFVIRSVPLDDFYDIYIIENIKVIGGSFIELIIVWHDLHHGTVEKFFPESDCFESDLSEIVVTQNRAVEGITVGFLPDGVRVNKDFRSGQLTIL